MPLQKLEPKQRNQMILLSVSACGLFGYFAYQMITPPAAAAGSAVSAAAPTAAAPRVAVTGASAAAPDTTVPLPGMGMRDPFVPGILDPAALSSYKKALQDAQAQATQKAKEQQAKLHPAKVQMASLPERSRPGTAGGFSLAPSAEALPPIARVTENGPLAPMPVAPPPPLAPPAWTVTGVLRSGDAQVAILRSGDQRRIVKRGDEVDSQFRVVSVTRNSVVLGHGDARFTLPLGSAKSAAAAARPPAQTGASMPEQKTVTAPKSGVTAP